MAADTTVPSEAPTIKFKYTRIWIVRSRGTDLRPSTPFGVGIGCFGITIEPSDRTGCGSTETGALSGAGLTGGARRGFAPVPDGAPVALSDAVAPCLTTSSTGSTTK
jgi:hypothetical protein